MSVRSPGADKVKLPARLFVIGIGVYAGGVFLSGLVPDRPRHIVAECFATVPLDAEFANLFGQFRSEYVRASLLPQMPKPGILLNLKETWQ